MPSNVKKSLVVLSAVAALALFAGVQAHAAQAAKIVSVVQGSVAEDAGLRKGDLILKINGKNITSNAAFKAALKLALKKNDGELSMVVLRK